MHTCLHIVGIMAGENKTYWFDRAKIRKPQSGVLSAGDCRQDHYLYSLKK